MSDLSEDEQIRLLFKQGGIEIIGNAEESFRKLTDGMEKTSEAADQLAKYTKGVDERLKEVIASIPGMGKFLGDVVGTEDGGSGFAGLAANVMRAEKAIHSITTGSGLGRLGGLLEPIAAALGGPAGIGMAIGALLYAIEPAIPKIKEFFDAWDKGVKPIDDVTDAIRRFDLAQGSSAEKRALSRVDRMIGKLEEKEDEQGWLSPIDKDKLYALREKSQEAHEAIDLEAAIATGPSEAQSKRAAAVRKAMSEMGGGISAVSDLEKSGEDPQAARRIVAAALQGNLNAIGQVQSGSQQFSGQYSFFDPIATRTRREQEAGDKTIADVEAKTEKNVEHGEKEKRREEKEKRREFDQTMDENEREIERYDKEQEAAWKQKQHVTDQNAREYKRLAEREARENTPEAINQRARAAQQNQIMGAVQDVDRANQDAGGRAASPDFLNQVTRQATQNVTLGADLATAVSTAIYQVKQKIAEDFMRGMQQQYRSQQLMGSPY